MTDNVADRPNAGDERGSFDVEDFAEELAIAAGNRALGTSLWFENDRVRVFEVGLEPGERGPFHVHDRRTSGPSSSPAEGCSASSTAAPSLATTGRGNEVPGAFAAGRARARPGERRVDEAALCHGRAEGLGMVRPTSRAEGRGRRRFARRPDHRAATARRLGCDVQVFERSFVPLEGRGAGIVLHPVTTGYFKRRGPFDLERVSSSLHAPLRHGRGRRRVEEPIAYRFTSYATLYAALVATSSPTAMPSIGHSSGSSRGDGDDARSSTVRTRLPTAGRRRRVPVDRAEYAVPKGPPGVRRVRRMARHASDQRLPARLARPRGGPRLPRR